jgi:fructose-bisphosphate aldolase, class I
MFDLVHLMRTRIITSPAFTGERILGAILFEGTMDRDVEGVPSARYLWHNKHIVPFVKVDKGLEAEEDGVQPDEADARARRAAGAGPGHEVFGTKMRSVIKLADRAGIAAIVEQQVRDRPRILDHGLVPILEPEVDIHAPDKDRPSSSCASTCWRRSRRWHQPIMLKLTIPTEDGFYTPLMEHPKVLRVVGPVRRLQPRRGQRAPGQQPGLIASFSRALLSDLSHQQSDEEFDRTLDTSIQAIYDASVT